MTIGGSAVPRVMLEKFERDYDVSVKHAWGMTELSPLGTIASFKAGMENMSFDQQMDIKVKQGRAPFGVEMKITDDEGNELPRDGKAFGHLMVRGPFIVGEYIKGDGGQILDEDGFFDTGDVATIDALGFMQITDRSKDVIKSGGEWISSIEIENVAVGCEGVTWKPPLSACRIRNGMNGHCLSSLRMKALKSVKSRFWVISRAKLPNGGCLMM